MINSRGCYNVLSLSFDLVAVSRFPESRGIPAFEHWLIIRRIRTLSNLRAISPIGKRRTILLALASLRGSRISLGFLGDLESPFLYVVNHNVIHP